MGQADDIFCIGCGYDLRGMRERCPECGRAFDAAIVGSVARHAPPGRLTRALLRPLGWPSVVLVGASSAGMLGLGIYPSFYYLENIAIITLWVFLLALLYLGRCVVGCVCALRCSIPGNTAAGGRQAFALAAVVGIVVLLLGLKAPLQLGFLTALPTLSAAVQAHERGEAVGFDDRRIGLYVISADFNSDVWYLRRDVGPEGRPSQTTAFDVEDGGESYFFHSPAGYRGFYNTGNCGHLWGDWYWGVND